MTLARAPRAPRRAPSELTFTPDRDLIEAYAAEEPSWLADDRRAALARFDELPTETNQLYTPYIDLRAADLAEVRPFGPADAPGADVETAGLPAGVTVEPLRDWILREPDAARTLITEGAPAPADDKLGQLTRAAWNQGVVIRVAPGAQVEQPIVVRWPVGAPGRALLTRTIIELGAGAKASIVEDILGAGVGGSDAQSLFTGTTEVILGDGAELAMASIQDLLESTVAFQNRHASIGEGAKLHWALAQLGGRVVRSRVDNVLAGDRSSVEQVEIVFGSDDQLFDLTSYTRHVGRDTTGNLLSKAVLLDASRTYLKGMITIDKTAIGTDSFLGEFGMNLSKKARSVAIPSLEIDQPDCRRAAHSSSVGPIDETQLFYLESRGIPPDEARKFIVLGFLEPVVARVPLEAERDRLRELLEAKWIAGTEDAAAA
ncbi:MAG TPA: SufD family Fe-S cluster assembly protein [Candidatus Limnocylindrales bacterium]|nr:SufD family Fe-S cluster assembly protein [Candidatus Limnocylindrales bacterium]